MLLSQSLHAFSGFLQKYRCTEFSYRIKGNIEIYIVNNSLLCISSDIYVVFFYLAINFIF